MRQACLTTENEKNIKKLIKRIQSIGYNYYKDFTPITIITVKNERDCIDIPSDTQIHFEKNQKIICFSTETETDQSTLLGFNNPLKCMQFLSTQNLHNDLIGIWLDEIEGLTKDDKIIQSFEFDKDLEIENLLEIEKPGTDTMFKMLYGLNPIFDENELLIDCDNDNDFDMKNFDTGLYQINTIKSLLTQTPNSVVDCILNIFDDANIYKNVDCDSGYCFDDTDTYSITLDHLKTIAARNGYRLLDCNETNNRLHQIGCKIENNQIAITDSQLWEQYINS